MLVTSEGFIDCNQSALEIFGYKNKSEFLKLHPSDMSPEFQPNGENSYYLSNKYIEEAQNREMPNIEWIHKRKNGDIFPCEILLSPILLNNKKAIHAVIRDISVRKKAQEAVKKSEAKFRKLSDLSPSGISIQRKNKYFYVNQAWTDITGYEINEVDKVGPYDVVHPDMHEFVKERSNEFR